MSEVRSTTRSYLPVFVINWLFGIGVIECPLGRPRPLISLAYSLVCMTSYCAATIYCFCSMSATPYLKKIALPIKIFFFSQLLLTVTTIGLGWFRSEALHKCLSKVLAAASMMSRIGIKNDFVKMFRAQTKRIISDLAFVLSVTGINSFMIVNNDAVKVNKILMAITISYPALVMFIADTTFMYLVKKVCARYRFSQVNDVLRAMLSSTNESPQHRRILMQVKELVNVPVYIINGLPRNQALVIKIAKQVHLLLIKVCQEADNLYGVQILITLVAAFGVITGNLYMLIILLTDPHTPTELLHQSLVTVNVWIAYYAIKIGFISYVCDYCKKESIETGDIINQLYDDSTINSESQTEIRDFNVQLIQKPLKFTAYGFIDLDFTLLQGMIATITTYLMILIQLGQVHTDNNDHNSAKKDVL